jgi:hypothetical protein
MTHQEIANELKDITVRMFEKDEKDRDWYAELGDLIDRLETASE